MTTNSATGATVRDAEPGDFLSELVGRTDCECWIYIHPVHGDTALHGGHRATPRDVRESNGALTRGQHIPCTRGLPDVITATRKIRNVHSDQLHRYVGWDMRVGFAGTEDDWDRIVSVEQTTTLHARVCTEHGSDEWPDHRAHGSRTEVREPAEPISPDEITRTTSRFTGNPVTSLAGH